jgi:hypothetical protein
MSFGTFSRGTQSFGTDDVSVSTGVGALASQASLISGAGLSLSAGTGALTAQSAAISGNGLSLSTGIGALASQSPAVNGTGVSLSSATGALLDQAAAIVGVGVSLSTGTGALTAGVSVVAGVGGQAQQAAPFASYSHATQSFGGDDVASAVVAVTGTGALVCQNAIIVGVGSASVDGRINYAIRDQAKRDKRRLAAKKAQVVEELKKWRDANGSETTPPDAGLDQPSDEGGDNYPSRGVDVGVLGGQLASISGRDGPGGYTGGVAGLDGSGTVISLETIATIDRIKRNNDLALILIMANA